MWSCCVRIFSKPGFVPSVFGIQALVRAYRDLGIHWWWYLHKKPYNSRSLAVSDLHLSNLMQVKCPTFYRGWIRWRSWVRLPAHNGTGQKAEHSNTKLFAGRGFKWIYVPWKTNLLVVERGLPTKESKTTVSKGVSLSTEPAGIFIYAKNISGIYYKIIVNMTRYG